jgi:hypothetical protein
MKPHLRLTDRGEALLACHYLNGDAALPAWISLANCAWKWSASRQTPRFSQPSIPNHLGHVQTPGALPRVSEVAPNKLHPVRKPRSSSIELLPPPGAKASPPNLASQTHVQSSRAPRTSRLPTEWLLSSKRYATRPARDDSCRKIRIQTKLRS